MKMDQVARNNVNNLLCFNFNHMEYTCNFDKEKTFKKRSRI